MFIMNVFHKEKILLNNIFTTTSKMYQDSPVPMSLLIEIPYWDVTSQLKEVNASKNSPKAPAEFIMLS